jgi:hypothetical protein
MLLYNFTGLLLLWTCILWLLMGKQWDHWPVLADCSLLPSDSANYIWWILEQKLLGWKALLSHSQSRIHVANGSLFPHSRALRRFQAAGALPKSCVTWLSILRFPAASYSFLVLCKIPFSYWECTAKYLAAKLLRIEKAEKNCP